MSLDRKILDRIERENLKIRPSWFFAVKNFVCGTGTFLATIFGSLSLALLLQIMKHRWENLNWLSVPYLHLFLFGIFLIVGYWLVTRIDLLYKLKFVPILTVLFFFSLSFGYLTFASGEARKIERKLEKVPLYVALVPVKKELPWAFEGEKKWHNREKTGEERANKQDSEEYHHYHHDKDREQSKDGDEKKRYDDNSERKEKFKTKLKNEIIEEIEEKRSADKKENSSEKGEVKGVSHETAKDESEEKEVKDTEEKEDSEKKDAKSSASEEKEDETNDED